MDQKEHRYLVADKIKSIDVDSMEITFKLSKNVILPGTLERAKNLLQELIRQEVDMFSGIPIRGLELVWKEEVKEDRKT